MQLDQLNQAASPQWTGFVQSWDHSLGLSFEEFGLRDTMFNVRNLITDLDNEDTWEPESWYDDVQSRSSVDLGSMGTRCKRSTLAHVCPRDRLRVGAWQESNYQGLSYAWHVTLQWARAVAPKTCLKTGCSKIPRKLCESQAPDLHPEPESLWTRPSCLSLQNVLSDCGAR